MNVVSASAHALVLVIEETESLRWRTTVRSATNARCAYTSSHLYEDIEDAKSAALRIVEFIWGERVGAGDLLWSTSVGEQHAAAMAASGSV